MTDRLLRTPYRYLICRFKFYGLLPLAWLLLSFALNFTRRCRQSSDPHFSLRFDWISGNIIRPNVEFRIYLELTTMGNNHINPRVRPNAKQKAEIQSSSVETKVHPSNRQKNNRRLKSRHHEICPMWS
jgi:hypothetical protein